MRLLQPLPPGFGTSRHAVAWPSLIAGLIAVLSLSGPVCADIYKSVDTEGRVTYSNIPSRGAKRIEVGVPSSNSGHKASVASTPADFPRVDSSTQKSRDSVRRRILSDELATEEKLLAEVQSAYKRGNPDLLPGEQTTSPKYIERVGKLRDSISLHEKNIVALKQELTALK